VKKQSGDQGSSRGKHSTKDLELHLCSNRKTIHGIPQKRGKGEGGKGYFCKKVVTAKMGKKDKKKSKPESGGEQVVSLWMGEPGEEGGCREGGRLVYLNLLLVGESPLDDSERKGLVCMRAVIPRLLP